MTDYFNELRTRNAASSPLLRIPAELRNKIYDYATGGFVVHLERSPRFGTLRLRANLRPIDGSGPQSRQTWEDALGYYISNLRQVCHQMRMENPELAPYTENIFHIPQDASVYLAFMWRFLSVPQAAAIRTIALTMNVPRYNWRVEADEDGWVHVRNNMSLRWRLPNLRRLIVLQPKRTHREILWNLEGSQFILDNHLRRLDDGLRILFVDRIGFPDKMRVLGEYECQRGDVKLVCQ